MDYLKLFKNNVNLPKQQYLRAYIPIHKAATSINKKRTTGNAIKLK